MCGIVGFTGKKNAAEFLTDGLERLEYRGYDSAGIAVLNGEIEVFKTEKRVETLKNCLPENLGANIGIGHTRWATHGAPTVENAHPHLSQNGKFAVVHNGIIENYAELRAELETEGVIFSSETDTEVVPQLLEKYYTGNLKETVFRVLNRLEGSYALGILCSDNPDTLVAAKQFSPLIIGLQEDYNIIASDICAIIPHTNKALYLEDGDTAFITPFKTEVLNRGGSYASRKISVLDFTAESAQKEGYEHFMLKEIMEQPDAVRRTLEGRLKDSGISFDNLNLDTKMLRNLSRIQIVACGSAYHAGMVGKYVLEETLRIPVDVDIASEFRYRNPVVNKNTLTIVISQSGETADTLAAALQAKKQGSYVLAIVNVVASSIAKMADGVIYTYAGPEIAVATTKGYSTQIVQLYLLALLIAEKLETLSHERISEAIESLKLLPEAIESALKEAENIKKLASVTNSDNSVFFIGRNIDYAVALEGSLKLKEISYIHSEAYPAGELKHGTIALIEEGTDVFALCACERLNEKMLSNIKEVSARGARVIACLSDQNSSIKKEVQAVINIPKTDPLFSASTEVIPFQLFAYYTALSKGCDIDKPRNLAKSVTVE